MGKSTSRPCATITLQRFAGCWNAPSWSNRRDFRTALDRLAHEDDLNAILCEAFTKRDSADWAERLTQADVMNAVVNSYGDYFDDAHVASTRGFVWQDHPVVGPVPVPSVPGAPETPGISPEIGQDTRRILRDAGLSEADIDRLAGAGAIGLADLSAAP